MFICEEKCLKLYKNWSLSRSYGPCEICGEKAGCANIPSKYLELKEPKKIPQQQVDLIEGLMILMGLKPGLPVKRDPDKEEFTDAFGNHIVNVHRKEDCNPPCTIHAHSEHKLADKPLLWRNDRGIFEHMCQHGTGHPCPDSLPKTDSGIHGCCGCCTKG